MDRQVYLDYAATTPVDARVLDEMLPYFGERYGNPNSLYALGRQSHKALDDARESFMNEIGAANPNEIIFTAGGTESDNAVLFGVTEAAGAKKGRHVIVSAFEHHAVLEPAHYLEKHGYEVTYLKPREDGLIHAEDLAAALRDDTTLVSVMHANNELGTLQPIRELSDVAHERGAYFHADAAQSLGKVPFNVDDLGLDAASFSAHKVYGPKGTGALYLKRGTPFSAMLRGGGQEFRKRSGTQNVAGAVGFAAALRIMNEEMGAETPRLTELRDTLTAGVLAIENTRLSAGAESPRLPNIANIIILGVEGESMLLQLDAKGIAVSTGSACSSGSLEPSHVLLSIGCKPEHAHGSLRLTVGRFTTPEDVQYFLATLPPIVERLRAMSPVYERMFK